MSAERVEHAAALLLRARKEGVALPAEATSLPLESRAEAYRVQALLAAELGPVAGWKTGAPSPEAEPIIAPIFEDLVHVSPARLEATRFHRLGIEAEIAFRLGRDLPVRGWPYAREDIIGAIDAMLPAIEIVDSRCGAFEQLDPSWQLADNQINGGLVIGAAKLDWRRLDPEAQPVTLAVDGAMVVSGKGGNSAGDPLRLLVWMANNVGDHCGGLRAGQVITASLTGLRFVVPGAAVRAELPGLGAVEARFDA
jgi:2-keto-4-pentenoate hydratase